MQADNPLLPDERSLFEDAPCGLVVTRQDGLILKANKTFLLWTGFSEAQLLGRRFQELLTMGGRIFHQTHWAPLMQMQGSVAEVKLEIVHQDTRIITMLLNGVRREHDSGVFYELALFGTTDRDKYERELLIARKSAEALLQAKTAAELALQQAQAELNEAYEVAQRRALFAEQMIAIVSHDLKNPLTAIKMASSVMARNPYSEKDTRMLGHISQSADRAERMIGDLLDLALARVGRGIAVNRKPQDLHALAAKCVEELRVTFPAATLLHVCQGEGSVSLDADRVQQVIGNLVGNSVAYGDLRQPVTITSHVTGDGGRISVRNFGPVIAASRMPSLFEPMTRDSEVQGDIRSVGLGLFIVREIAKAHGGDVSAASSEGDGTRFEIVLPL